VNDDDTDAVDVYAAKMTLDVALKLGLDEFSYGSCGPAAVAINRVLFGGKGRYIVASRKSDRSGHVAVWNKGSLFDYHGLADFNTMAAYVDHARFAIVSDVRETTVVKHFCPSYCLPIAHAEAILERAVKLIAENGMMTNKGLQRERKKLERELTRDEQ